ncbi:MAG: NAD(P)-binding protein, partial [Pseudomonadota bacterium]
MESTSKKKIAVLGGGIGALSSVFYLTEEENWQDNYEITVYQQGWRLGGKCASGRDMRPGYGYRVYEHGLHIFAGFYDQAFDLLRRSYEAIDRPYGHPNRTVWDSFVPQDQIALVENPDHDDPHHVWYLNFPSNDAKPGEDLGIPSLMVMLEKLVGMLLHVSPHHPENNGGKKSEGIISWLLHEAKKILGDFVHKVEDEIEADVFNAAIHEVVKLIDQEMTRVHDAGSEIILENMRNRFMKAALLVQSILYGVAKDKVIQNGFEVLDVYDWSEWIYNSAVAVGEKFPEWGDPKKRAQDLIDWSPILSLYDYAFAFQFGENGKLVRNFAAGTALKASLLLIAYKGHFFWKMNGAMGDVVIAPIYLALKERGVKFEFFRRITDLNIAADSDVVESIDMVSQVRLKDPSREYNPVFDCPVPGFPEDVTLECWPATPLWDQLHDGERLKREHRDFEHDDANHPGAEDEPLRLKRGEDFDDVIIGISVGGLKQVCSSFPERLPNSNWGPMFDKITLTRTCAMQIWPKRSLPDLGNKEPDRTLTGAAQVYSTWSDMSHLLDREVWDGRDRPRSIIYFCGQIDGDEEGDAALDKSIRLGKDWLKGNSAKYWPNALSASSPYALEPSVLYDPDPSADGDVFDRQYFRNNYAPSELYVQSPKNSIQARMDANESGLSNLFLTGDWTRSEISSGCVEAAARSGARCARAVQGKSLDPLPKPKPVPVPPPPSANDLPAYVQDGNLYDSLGAAQLSDVVMHNFCLPADKTKLQAWLDKTFKAPSGGKVAYEALTGQIFLGVAELGKVQALGHGNEQKGFTTEIDVTVWILARKKGDPFAIRWIPAYLFVNSGPVLATGREVWGFPKQLAEFDFSPQHNEHGKARTFNVNGWVVSPYKPTTETRWAPIIEIKPKAPSASPSGILPSLKHLADKAVTRLTDDLISVGGAIESAIGAGNMTMAFLKQFPDATDPQKACYQAIIEATAKTNGYRASGLTDDEYEINITSYDSMPFLNELGIQPGWQTVGQGMWIDFDFEQELGKALW